MAAIVDGPDEAKAAFQGGLVADGISASSPRQ